MTERIYWQRMRASKLSRRTLLSASGRAGVGAAGLALVGCGDDDDDLAVRAVTQAQAQQQPQQSAPRRARQRVQEGAAEQQAQQAVQQADTQARQAQSTQQAQEGEPQTVAEGPAIIRGGKLRLTTTAPAHDYFDPHRSIFGTTQSWMSFYMNYLIRWRNKEQGIMESALAAERIGARRGRCGRSGAGRLRRR